MIQDIYPSRLDNSFINATPSDDDIILFFDDEGKILICEDETKPCFMTFGKAGCEAVYLFSIDDKKYFLADKPMDPPDDHTYRTIRQVRDTADGAAAFAAFTAYHLWKWYADNRYCGKCGALLSKDVKERALSCKKCGNIIYPRINPAVIVGVINGDSILITRYRQGYGHNALIAGFCEIGETLEETVAREVGEEAGLSVANIRYYKSQPWGMAQDLLVGFFCDVTGDAEIKMDEGELKYAAWVERDDLELQPNNLSLTNEMMKMFKENRI